MKMPDICIGENRREAVRVANLNGLDFVEVSEDDPKTITVYFLGKAPPVLQSKEGPPRSPIARRNVLIEGGRRVRDLRVRDVIIHRSGRSREDDWMEVKLDKVGDFSPYTLRLVEIDKRGRPIVDRDELGREQFRPFHGFDPRYSQVKFYFKPECPTELDCRSDLICPPEKRFQPEINYLAKDYASFRQLILDRLALTMPDWQERHVPDLGITLVELLSYAGDYLSYYQDAVATEAYLETARKRISVRRHARLVDYRLHEGCNARAWIFVEVTGGKIMLKPEDIAFMTPPKTGGRALEAVELDHLPSGSFEYFEPMAKELQFFAAHNQISFYTWGDKQCCLPRGATTATLVDHWVPQKPAGSTGEAEVKHKKDYCDEPHHEKPPPRPTRELQLQAGDYLLFEELIGPKTGNPADHDPTHRQVVRLTRVTEIEDELALPGYDEKSPRPLLEIEWAPEDALLFPLCLSAIGPADASPPDAPCRFIKDISVARGNVILVDHGRTFSGQPFDPGPTGETKVICEGEGRVSETMVTPEDFRPQLKRGPLVFAEPLKARAPASLLLQQDVRKAEPSIKLIAEGAEPNEWLPRADLLRSEADASKFVVEIDDEGLAHLRFGDGQTGRMPDIGLKLSPRYRIGGGVAGNVGVEAITQIVWPGSHSDDGIVSVRNPLPAQGGSRPEPIAEAKLFAPRAFRKELQRAIIPEDYAAIVMREFSPQVQRAGAELRWTGSWYSVRVAIDPRDSLDAAPGLLEKILKLLQRYRRIGHDVQVVPARYVPLDVQMTICVRPHYLRGHVEAALLEVFQSGLRSDGPPGFFHPDNLSFGDSIYVSRIIAAAQSVEGVESVQVTKLERLFEGGNHELDKGLLPIGPLEVARLDADPINPENGQLRLDMKGGR
jgi:hypothetical protein